MKTNCTTVKEVAGDIAKCLREQPQTWGQGQCFHHETTGGPCCLYGQIDARCQEDVVLSLAAKKRYRALLGGSHQSIMSWNDRHERTVQDIIDISEKVAANAN